MDNTKKFDCNIKSLISIFEKLTRRFEIFLQLKIIFENIYISSLIYHDYSC